MRTLSILLTLGLGVASWNATAASGPITPANSKHQVKTSKKAATQKQVGKQMLAKKGSKPGAQKSASGELQTDVKFDDSVLHGQYQTPEEALAKVENEKSMSDLIGVRKHFKDRLSAASEQE